jgi:hypothetical protein
LSLDVSGPHRMMSGVSAIGALCRQRAFAHLFQGRRGDLGVTTHASRIGRRRR